MGNAEQKTPTARHHLTLTSPARRARKADPASRRAATNSTFGATFGQALAGLVGPATRAYPVEGPDGTITGLITLTQLRDGAPEARATTLVGGVAIPLHQVPTAAPHEPLTALLERMRPDTGARVCLSSTRVTSWGIITATDIARLIDVRGLDLPRPATGQPY